MSSSSYIAAASISVLLACSTRHLASMCGLSLRTLLSCSPYSPPAPVHRECVLAMMEHGFHLYLQGLLQQHNGPQLHVQD